MRTRLLYRLAGGIKNKDVLYGRCVPQRHRFPFPYPQDRVFAYRLLSLTSLPLSRILAPFQGKFFGNGEVQGRKVMPLVV
ncbi:MAG TPA: hypothetical protein V6C85_02085 [Allocoleopsis sp.]